VPAGEGLVWFVAVQIEAGGLKLTDHLAITVGVEGHWTQRYVGLVLAAPELTALRFE
jgi:hypothetical protein